MRGTAERYTLDSAEIADRMRQLVHKHPHALLFASVHGSKLHGFDIAGLRPRHPGLSRAAPRGIVIGLDGGQESIRKKDDDLAAPGVELATHDVRNYFTMLLKNNGNILEELFSPLVLVTGPYPRGASGDSAGLHHPQTLPPLSRDGGPGAEYNRESAAGPRPSTPCTSIAPFWPAYT